MAKKRRPEQTRSASAEGGTLVLDATQTEVPPVKQGESFESQVVFQDAQQLHPQDFLSDTPTPGFSVRFRQALLNAGEDYRQLLQAYGVLRGTLTVNVTVGQNPPDAWYQETDTWMIEAARAAIRNPGRSQKANETPEGLLIKALFQPSIAAKAIAPKSGIGQDSGLNEVQHPLDRMPSVEEQFQSLLQVISQESPPDFVAQSERFVSLGHTFRKTIAAILQAPLNAHLKTLPQETPKEKQAIAVWVNGQMRNLGLAIRCPKTGRPSVLISDIKESGSEIGRFRLENRDEEGAKARTLTSKSLPELELMEDLPRKEPLLNWRRRAEQREPRQRG